MRIIYLKQTIDYDNFVIETYYKIAQVNNEETILLEVYSDRIQIQEYDEFFDTVNFVKNTLCEGNECIEIDRKEFDEFYKKTIEQINIASLIKLKDMKKTIKKYLWLAKFALFVSLIIYGVLTMFGLILMFIEYLTT